LWRRLLVEMYSRMHSDGVPVWFYNTSAIV
jgi:hypothetical protein